MKRRCLWANFSNLPKATNDVTHNAIFGPCPFGTHQDLVAQECSPQSSPRRRELTMDGGLYLEHQVQLLAQGQLNLRGDGPQWGSDPNQGCLSFPETEEYSSALRLLAPADLRSFSKRLQEANQRVKGSLYQVALAERMRHRGPKRLVSRPAVTGVAYDPQTGRPVNMPARRSLSSADAKRVDSNAATMRLSNHVRVVAPASSGGNPRLSLDSSKKTPESKDVASTPATSIGTRTPATAYSAES